MTAPTRVTVFAGTATMMVALSLTPVYATANWFWRSLGAAIVIGLVGAGLRRLSAPRPLIVVGQLLAVLVYLGLLYSDNAILGLIPGPGVLEDLGSAMRSGLADADTYGPKVPETTGILLLTVGGIALINVAVDAAAATYRRASLAGLPLLALYTVPASVLEDGVAWPLFLIGALGFIGLLIAEGQERLVRWGRPLVAGLSAERAGRMVGPSRVDTTPFGQIGRRIGAAAIGLAIIVPAVLPLQDGLLLGGSGGLGGGGGGAGRSRVHIDPLVSLRRNFFAPEDIDVVRLTSNGNPNDLYLRMATLDTFDGVQWSQSQPILDKFDNGIPRLLGVSDNVARHPITTRAEISDALESYFLPVPYPLTELDINGTWRIERNTRNIISSKGPNQLADKSYVARSVVLEPTPRQLANAPGPPIDMRRYLELPDQLPTIVEQQAREVTEGATSSYDAALRLQSWLRGPTFDYDTSQAQQGTGLSAIELFLTERKGYCEQFAATMAVMARLLGIPARVNVGFSAGRRDADGTIVVSTHDMHAWPELYFDGAGWVRFEPTPFDSSRGGPPTFVSADTEADAINTPEPTETAGPSATPSGGTSEPTSTAGACPLPRPELCDANTPIDSGSSGGSRLPQLLLAGLGALVILGSVPGLLRVGIRRRRWRLAGSDPGARADVAWLELLDTARDLGYGRHDADTPRQTAYWLVKEARLRTRHQEPLMRLTTAVERARYARTPADDATLSEDLAMVQGALGTRMGRLRQVQAVLLPRSTWDVAHWVAERIADVLDGIDRAASWVSRRVLRIGRGETAG